MEIMDVMDTDTPIYGKSQEIIPPYVGDEPCDQIPDPPYTEEIDNLQSKFYKCLDIMSCLSFFMLGAVRCRCGTKAWKQ